MLQKLQEIQDMAKAIGAERDRYRVALDRIYGHTDPGVTPGTPAPDPRWIRLVAEAALYPK